MGKVMSQSPPWRLACKISTLLLGLALTSTQAFGSQTARDWRLSDLAAETGATSYTGVTGVGTTATYNIQASGSGGLPTVAIFNFSDYLRAHPVAANATRHFQLFITMQASNPVGAQDLLTIATPLFSGGTHATWTASANRPRHLSSQTFNDPAFKQGSSNGNNSYVTFVYDFDSPGGSASFDAGYTYLSLNNSLSSANAVQIAAVRLVDSTSEWTSPALQSSPVCMVPATLPNGLATAALCTCPAADKASFTAPNSVHWNTDPLASTALNACVETLGASIPGFTASMAQPYVLELQPKVYAMATANSGAVSRLVISRSYLVTRTQGTTQWSTSCYNTATGGATGVAWRAARR